MGSIHSNDTKMKNILKNVIPIVVIVSLSTYSIFRIFEYDLLIIFLGSLIILILSILLIRHNIVNLVKMGFNNYNKIRHYMDGLEENYGELLRKDLIEIDLLLSNERHFVFLFFELFVSAFKYSLEVRENFYVRDKGWIKRSYKSSRNALMRYMFIYTRTYEGIFQFFITYLIELIMIKRNFYYKVKESVLNNVALKLNTIEAFNYLREMFKSKFETPEEIINLSELEKRFFNLNKYFSNPASLKNIDKKKNGIIKSFQRMRLDPVIIECFEKFNNQNLQNILWYKYCFYDIYQNRTINTKLDFLKENNYDFNNWIIPQLRHKSVHHLNWIFVRTDRGECGIKIIIGELKGNTYDIHNYWDYLCRLYALSFFLIKNLIYRENILSKNESKEFSISLKKINKFFKNNKNRFRRKIDKNI